MRVRRFRLQAQRFLRLGARADEVAGASIEIGQVDVHARRQGSAVPRHFQRGAGGGGVALLEQDPSPQGQQVGIVGDRAETAVDGAERARELPLIDVGAGQVRPRHRGRGRELRRLLEVGHRLGGPMGVEQAAAEVELHVEGARRSAGETREDPDRSREVGRPVEPEPLPHIPLVRLEVGEPVLRVGARGRSREEAASQVAQRRQALRGFGVHGRLLGGAARIVGPQARPHGGGDLRSRPEEVLRLRGVVGDAVQLGARSVDVLPAVAAQRSQRRIAEMQAPVEALGIGLVVGDAGAGTQGGGPGHAARGRRGKREQVQHAGKQVDAPELAADP